VSWTLSLLPLVMKLLSVLCRSVVFVTKFDPSVLLSSSSLVKKRSHVNVSIMRRAGSQVVRIDPLCFLAGRRKK